MEDEIYHSDIEVREQSSRDISFTIPIYSPLLLNVTRLRCSHNFLSENKTSLPLLNGSK